MKLKKMLVAHVLVLGLVVPFIAYAKDFTFNVGVNFTNLHPDITTVKIVCYAQREQSTGSVGIGTVDLTVPANGEINKTIQVKFNASPGGNPADAKFYLCQMILVASTVDSSNIPVIIHGTPSPDNDSSCNNTNNDWICAKTGTQLIEKLTGRITAGKNRVISRRGTRSKSEVGRKIVTPKKERGR